MKRILKLHSYFTLLLVVVPLLARGTVFFSDNFTSGNDTINQASIPGGNPAAGTSYTSWDIASSKGCTTNDVIYPGFFHAGLNSNSSSGFWEYQAMFRPSNDPAYLVIPGDYIEYSVTFTNIGCLIGTNSTTGPLLWIGLYNSGGNLPLAGQLSDSGLQNDSSSPYANGNCANWQGYVSQIASNGTGAYASCIFTRPIQNGETGASSHQDLVCFPGRTGSFKEPVGTQYLVTPAAPINLVSNGLFTLSERITLVSNACVTITNTLLDSGNNIIFQQGTTNIVGAGYLTSGFDGMSFGALSVNASSLLEVNITKVLVTGRGSPYVDYPFIYATLTGSTLTLNWAPNWTGMILQSNMVSLMATDQWFNVPNSSNVDSCVTTINYASTNVFYRLVFPQ